MNDTDLRILEMYYQDGMKETEIAESLGLSLLTVHEVLAAWENGEYKTR
jgi:DNA-binding transcriptional regulator LsrR (DeoR family)